MSVKKLNPLSDAARVQHIRANLAYRVYTKRHSEVKSSNFVNYDLSSVTATKWH